MQIFKYIHTEKISNLIKNIFIVAFCLFPLAIHAQDINQNKIKSSAQMNDTSVIKATIESFLEAFGNDEMGKVRTMLLPSANIAGFSTSNGKLEVFASSAEKYFSQREGKQNRKFQEPVRQYYMNISQSMLAFVRADATVYYDGKANHNTNDFFVLMKDNGVWKILSGSYTTQPLEKNE